MEYIIIFDPTSRHPDPMLEGMDVCDNFLAKFSDYYEAKTEAEEWKKSGDCNDYAIYVRCTDERNHII